MPIAFAADNPTIHFLFRFRDLSARTIEEHQRIIDASGSCWWGWWKRPSEDERSDVWNTLAKEIAANKSTSVGLFDSGSQTDELAVHRMTITEVIPPIDDASVAPGLPAGEEALVPLYYRSSPFSRAWMRVTAFEKNPLSFFKRYTYTSPPRLRGIPQRYLDRLKDKRVVDAEELRTMDTTIWQVRPSTSTDHDEKFLAPAIRIIEPVSKEVINVRGDTILHLSDLHFATTNRGQHVWGYPGESGKRTLADAIAGVKDIANVGTVVISGDFTFAARQDEFEQAANAVNALLGVFGLDADNLVIVPGNHDIEWSKKPGDTYERNAVVNNAPDAAKLQYRLFYRHLMRHDANDALSMGRRFVFSNGIVVELCALNSSSLEQGRDYLAGMGRVEPQALEDVGRGLDWFRNENSIALRVLVVHHHVTATEDLESPNEFYKGFGMAIDAKQTMRSAAKAGVHLVLHGHRHRVFLWNEGVYELPEHTRERWELGRIAVLGAGSAGSIEVTNNSHYVNLIDVGSHGLTVRMLRSQSLGKFEVMQTWSAKFGIENGHLTMTPWVVARK